MRRDSYVAAEKHHLKHCLLLSAPSGPTAAEASPASESATSLGNVLYADQADHTLASAPSSQDYHESHNGEMVAPMSAR